MPRARRSRPWEAARRAEVQFGRQLRKLARQIGDIVQGFDLGQPGALEALERHLRGYSDLLRPWATSVTQRMLADVDQRNKIAFLAHARNISRGVQEVLATAPVQHAMEQLMQEQVQLITSLPLDAAQRVHHLAAETLVTGGRAKEIAAEIERSGHVSRSRAMLIARTEVARTASKLTEVRATAVGSEGYIWRTVGDDDVRRLHRKLEGKFILWSQPPVAGERGERAHAGCIYNCRCVPEPVLPNEF